MLKLVKGKTGEREPRPQPGTIEIIAEDEDRFQAIINIELSEEQQHLLAHPAITYPRQESVLAVHWHPEFIPMPLVEERLERLYPNRREELIIPTQHNRITNYGDYCGVEVDCYSRGFQRKVQLLLHFHKDRLDKAEVLKAALDHTFLYRSSQLFEFIHALTRPQTEVIEKAARATGASEDAISLACRQAAKLEKLLDLHYGDMPREAVKNKLLRDFLDALRPEAGDDLITRAQYFLQAVKQEVKARFPLDYFYRTSEIIEEARAIGAGIVIPHPEQFWPILLADYDVDGYEVWNPQSQEYTDFLISVLIKRNRARSISQRRLLVFMGDDTHLSEKIKAVTEGREGKAEREIGLQPPWEDLLLRKKLIMADLDRPRVISEYRARLAG